MSLRDLEPKQPVKYFLELSAIPRGSGNEKAASDYVAAFGRSKGLEVFQDAERNVVIKKPGTAGYENAPRVIIQGHLDMVCEKNKGVEHDFEKDGIKVVLDGEFLRAEGTTLGADNGAAVAMGMALLEAEDIPHPPLTVIMTTNEEVGLLGAAALPAEHLEGKYLINLDSGGEGVFTAGCAGGLRTVLTVNGTREMIPAGFTAVKLNVSGLLGGHSGANIKDERANANKLLGRILSFLSKDFDIRINSVSGGEKENSIPREAEVIGCIKSTDFGLAQNALNGLIQNIKDEYASSDPGVNIIYGETVVGSCFNAATSKKIISALNVLPNGVQHMEQNLRCFVETSVSLGVVKTEGDDVQLFSAVRSSVASRKYEVLGRIREAASAVGAAMASGSDYPQWTYKKESQLCDICAETYKELNGKEAQFITIHGGLECGLFLEKAPGLDIVAMGPVIHDAHSPDERLDAASFERCWELLKAILAKLL
ncbi:MAG: aminoacyl-histidine dipeptidase [Defluviitaleaceae bacterium]|nr:aminoacyl-histidine dipeptidase [Defluviitaleaceae bacterium]MCL2835584.1 aminoacyl-histidine dipeptidase [Defluviitaleaceae bacterium]